MSTRITGTARFFADKMIRGAFANPTRSFVLGDAKTDAVVYGCDFELIGVEEIAPGAVGTAKVFVVSDELPDLTRPIPIWSGQVIGELTDVRIVD